ncbi:MAG: lipoprotein insertase outer membrane protein LolB [Rickettsiella sp.]|nr:lipoprotein insertase outer membrane protein LolB [Rickettsiella sp.]
MAKIIALIFTFLLCGCTSFSQHSAITPAKPINHYLPWTQRKLQLNALQEWQANGNIAIHSVNGKGVNASFSWQQMKTDYQLRLFGPFGTQSILLIGNPQQVTLLAHNQHITAPSAESLLTQQLGLYLPVSQLYYWLRGLPTPQSRYTINFDAYNHLLQLRQSHWRINYLHYTNIGSIDIPDRIVLSNAQWTVQILITHWDLH